MDRGCSLVLFNKNLLLIAAGGNVINGGGFDVKGAGHEATLAEQKRNVKKNRATRE
jgi:hypothetical protein